MQSVEANLGKLKVLPDSEETREMVQISIRLHEFVLRAYKTEYLQLAKLYDEGESEGERLLKAHRALEISMLETRPADK